MWVRETLETMPQQALRRMQHAGRAGEGGPRREVSAGDVSTRSTHWLLVRSSVSMPRSRKTWATLAWPPWHASRKAV